MGNKTNTHCKKCEAVVIEGTKFCNNCGASITPDIICPKCDKNNPIGSKFCNNCGFSLEKESNYPISDLKEYFDFKEYSVYIFKHDDINFNKVNPNVLRCIRKTIPKNQWNDLIKMFKEEEYINTNTLFYLTLYKCVLQG